MSVFHDDFDRANGALGGNWVTCNANPAISGGLAGGDAYHEASNTTVSGRDYIRCTATVIYAMGGTYSPGPAVKMASGTSGCYVCSATYATGTITFYLFRKTGSSLTQLAATSWSSSQLTYYTYQLTYDHGTLTATFNGGHSITANDTTYATQDYAGYASRYALYGISGLTINGETGPALDVSPEVVGNYGATTELTLTGTETAWTSGTPGSPTFTVDNGTLSDQVVASTTSATVTYDPGDFLGTATITDPSTGMTDTILVTSDPNVVPPAATCPFDQDFIDTANATVLADTRGLPTLESIIVPAAEGWGNVYLQEAIADLWYAHFRPEDMPQGEHSGQGKLDNLLMWISGGYLPTMATPQPPPQTTLKEDMEELLAQLSDIRTQNDWTLGSVITELAGEGVPQHTDILAAIAGISGGSNQDVLDRLDEIQGAGGYSLSSLTLVLDLIRTIHNYNLGDVVDRLDARPTNLALAAAVASIEGAIAGLALEVGAVGAAVTAAAAETTSDLASDLASALALATGVADILLQLAQLKELLGSQVKPVRVPPIWPGIDNVTLGPIIALETTTLVPGPMHGVSVHISGCEPGTRYFDYDSIRSWSHVGALAFGNERGELEPFQVLGPAAAFYCAKTMAVADSCRLYRSRNVRGTIQSWMVNEG